MKQIYRMLIGRQFTVGDDTFTVCDVKRLGNRDLVEAIDSRPSRRPAARVRFPVDRVLQNLLVEEEIELRHPGFLGA